MPAMIFPPTPVDGQEVTQPNGKRYKYNAAKARWEVVPASLLSGGLVPLESIEITSGNNALILLDIANYAGFEVHIHRVRSVSGSVDMAIRTSADGGATFAGQLGDYAIANVGGQSSPAGPFGDGDMSTAEIKAIYNLDASSNAGGIIRVMNPGKANALTSFLNAYFYPRNNNTIPVTGLNSGHRRAFEVNDAMLLFLSSGNFIYLEYTLYGIRGA